VEKKTSHQPKGKAVVTQAWRARELLSEEEVVEMLISDGELLTLGYQIQFC